ncbi:type II secretion system protein GspG [Candidatus Auribacterota bacterium]
MNREKGFTLLELLTVIAIIIILAGILIPAVGKVRQKAKSARAQADIESLCIAVKMYEADFGAYPPDVAGSNDFKAYIGVELENTSIGDAGPYIEFREKDLSSGTFNDPWGKPYIYVEPGTHNEASFDIYSFGPNMTDNSGDSDDVTNW